MVGGRRAAEWAEVLIAVLAVVAAIVGGVAVSRKASAERGPSMVAATQSPSEATPTGEPSGDRLAEVPDETWQTDGGVEAIVYAGDVVFVGGDFGAVRPPRRGDGAVPRRNLAAFDVATGELLPWAPDPDGAVRTLVLSPGGDRLYVGGEFKRIGGVVRENVAALDVASGAPVGFALEVDTRVRTLALSPDGSVLYLGGRFSRVGGQPRTHLAAVRTADASVLPAFAPQVAHSAKPEEATVASIAVTADGETLYVGGTFTQVDGVPRVGVTKLNASSGAVDPAWDARVEPRTPDIEARVYRLLTTADGVYVCGDYFRVGGAVSANLARVDLATGARSTTWVATTDGGVNDCALSADRLYLGGHFQRAGGADADPKSNPTPTGEERIHLAAVDLITGALAPWDPGADSIPGVFAVAVDVAEPGQQGRVAVGGVFTRTGGFVRQQGFGQFAGTP